MSTVTAILAERQEISRIKGEFDEWAAKYHMAVEKFRRKQSSEACKRLYVLEQELGQIASKI